MKYSSRLLLYIGFLLPLFVGFGCKQRQSSLVVSEETNLSTEVHRDTAIVEIDSLIKEKTEVISLPKNFSLIDTNQDSGFILNLKYATDDNFTKKALYPCAKCIVRTEVAERLKIVSAVLKKKSYRLVLLDCYRPNDVQKELWKVKPNPHFVMRPWKGSLHSRGIAVDVSLADMDGQILDMGSEFDEFNTKSYYTSTEISEKQKSLRWILKSSMKQAGFSGIRTEWWHFQFGFSRNYTVENFGWNCDD